MVNKIHYRWDFVGLSTDTKPTPDESPKVVNGSTYYESDTSKLFVFYKDTWYERKPLGGGGGGSSYTAGDGIDITNNTISVDTEVVQPKLTAGTNITIDGDVISATGFQNIALYESVQSAMNNVDSVQYELDMMAWDDITQAISTGKPIYMSYFADNHIFTVYPLATVMDEFGTEFDVYYYDLNLGENLVLVFGEGEMGYYVSANHL